MDLSEIMEFLKVTKDMPGFDQVVTLQRSAFPPEEQFSVDQILTLAEDPNNEYLSFWERQKLCGIMLFCSGKNLTYLFYLAVNPDLRSQGYGSKILTWLMEHVGEKTLVLNIEQVGFDSPNEEQRVLRWRFYERLGYVKQPYYLLDDSGEYDIITSGTYFDPEEYMDLLIQIGFAKYHPKLLGISAAKRNC